MAVVVRYKLLCLFSFSVGAELLSGSVCVRVLGVLGVHVFEQVACRGLFCFLSPCSGRTKCYVD